MALPFSIYRSAEPVHKSVPVVGAAASGSVPGHISGSFVPGAVVEVGSCGKAFPFVAGSHNPVWR